METLAIWVHRFSPLRSIQGVESGVSGMDAGRQGQAQPLRESHLRVWPELAAPHFISYFFPCGTWMLPPLIVSGTKVRSDTTAPDGFVTFKPNWSVVPGSPLSTTVARKP